MTKRIKKQIEDAAYHHSNSATDNGQAEYSFKKGTEYLYHLLLPKLRLLNKLRLENKELKFKIDELNDDILTMVQNNAGVDI